MVMLIYLLFKVLHTMKQYERYETVLSILKLLDVRYKCSLIRALTNLQSITFKYGFQFDAKT